MSRYFFLCGVQGVGKTTYTKSFKNYYIIQKSELGDNFLNNLSLLSKAFFFVLFKKPLFLVLIIYFSFLLTFDIGFKRSFSRFISNLLKVFDLYYYTFSDNFYSNKKLVYDENIIQGFFVSLFYLKHKKISKYYFVLRKIINFLNYDFPKFKIIFLISDSKNILQNIKSRYFYVDKEVLNSFSYPELEIKRRQELIQKFITYLRKNRICITIVRKI